jgi:hypothetical protein
VVVWLRQGLARGFRRDPLGSVLAEEVHAMHRVELGVGNTGVLQVLWTLLCDRLLVASVDVS